MEYAPTYHTPRRAPKGVFVAAFIVLFCTSLSAADSIGFVPCGFDDTCVAAPVQEVALAQLPELGTPVMGAVVEVATRTALPVRIEIPAIDMDLPVQNPHTIDVGALDELLKNGPARYASSARLGESGNVLIFAHSSHLPIVHNQMFRAFNGIPDLSRGDSITIVGDDDAKYLYAVESVVKADTQSGVDIPLAPSVGQKLTLVTCDTLTGKSARYVLTAAFVGTL